MTISTTTTTLLDTATIEKLRETSESARLESSAGALPLLGVSLDTTIDALIQTTRVTQRFVNPSDEHLEVSYIFPLPSRAGVTDFVATLGSRRIDGILKERAAARADYALAVAQGQRAAIVEADRPDLFTVKIGNIAPGEEALIELVVTGPVVVEDSEATFRFPLVSAPRYVTGSPIDESPAGTGTSVDTDAVPDASRLNPPRLDANQPRPELKATIKITHPGLKAAVVTTSHPMAITAKSRTITVALDEGQRQDSDLLVRFALPSELTMSALVVPSRRKNQLSTWSVTIVAPPSPDATPRDVVFLLDRSGSMSGWKMVAARRAAARLIDTLCPADRFAIVAFDDQVDVFSPDAPEAYGASLIKLVLAIDRNRFAAVSWLSKLDARGGTEMERPVEEAVTLLGSTESAGREPVVVLVTDGQIGAEAQLLAAIEPRLSRTRFCVVGIDRSPNTSLLERLSKRSNGYVSFVESEDRLDEALVNLHRRVGRPDLLSVKVTSDGELIDADTAPGRLVDVFSGVPCIISGRYRASDTTIPELTVTATRPDGSSYQKRLTPTKVTAKGVTDLWARARIADLEDRYDARTGDVSAVRGEIIELSIAAKVLSRFTAFIAVDSEAQEISSSHELTQPVEMPGGWAMGASNYVGSLSNMAGDSDAMLGSVGMSFTASAVSMSTSPKLLGSSGLSATSAKMLRTGASAPAWVTDVGVTGVLNLILERLKSASDTKPARVADLVRRLQLMLSADPVILSVLITLTDYSKGSVTLADTISAVETAIRSLSTTTSESSILYAPQTSSPTYGGSMSQSPHAALGDQVTREFWS
jgi:Ca-activated chloride channel family protein